MGRAGPAPHTRVDTELFYLAFHAENLLDEERLAEHADLTDVRLLTDD